MIRRPLCLVWIACIALIAALRLAGAPIFGEPALNGEARKLIASDDSFSVMGRIESRRESRAAMQYILTGAVIQNHGSTLTADDRPLTFPRLLITTDKEEVFSIGSLVRCYGDVRRIDAPGNPGQFDARTYYESERIWYSMWSNRTTVIKNAGGLKENLSVLRNHLVNFLNRSLPEKDAGIIANLVLGERILIDDETRYDFQNAGIMHVLAISGLHISLIGMSLFTLLLHLHLPIPSAAGLSCLMMSLYCMMIGNPASALRALIMFIVMLGARITLRSYDLLSALSLAGILMLITNPGYLFQAGYQLSFAAVIGAGMVFPLMKKQVQQTPPSAADKLRARKLGRSRAGKILLHAKRALPDAILSYISITIVTLPLIAYHYFEISPAGILGNLLLVPLMEIVLISGVIGCLSFFVSVFLAKTALLPGTALLELVRAALRMIRLIPGSSIVTGKPELWQVIAYYIVLAAVILLISRKVPARRRNRMIARTTHPRSCMIAKTPHRRSCMTACILFLAACFILFHRKEPEFQFTMLDVGQGDCLFVHSQSGGTFLIDGGSSDVKNVGHYRIEPYLKQQRITRISGIFLSHDDGDHTNGILEILDEQRNKTTPIRIGAVYIPEWMKENRPLAKRCAALGIPIRTCSLGTRIQSGDLTFHVLHPFHDHGFQEGNEGSMAIRLDRRGFRILLTGDLEGQGEEESLPYLGRVDVLKVGHHGSKSATSDAFLNRTKPALALISAPEKSRYGHPHKEVLKRIRKHGCTCLVTKDCGAITIEFSRGQYRISRFRSI
jgi:competence protein ComEC